MKANNRFNLVDMKGNPKFQGFMTYDTRFNLTDMANRLCYYGQFVSRNNTSLFNIFDLQDNLKFQWKFQETSEKKFNVRDQSGIIFYGIIVQ